MKCLSENLHADFSKTVQGIKDLAALCKVKPYKLLSYSVFLTSGVEASKNLEEEDGDEILCLAIDEAFESLVYCYQIKPNLAVNCEGEDCLEKYNVFLNSTESSESDVLNCAASTFILALKKIVTLLSEGLLMFDNSSWCQDQLVLHKVHVEVLLALLNLNYVIKQDAAEPCALSQAITNLLQFFLKSFNSASTFILFAVPLMTVHLNYFPYESKFTTATTQTQLFAIIKYLLMPAFKNKDSRKEVCLVHIKPMSFLCIIIMFRFCPSFNQIEPFI